MSPNAGWKWYVKNDHPESPPLASHKGITGHQANLSSTLSPNTWWQQQETSPHFIYHTQYLKTQTYLTRLCNTSQPFHSPPYVFCVCSYTMYVHTCGGQRTISGLSLPSTLFETKSLLIFLLHMFGWPWASRDPPVQPILCSDPLILRIHSGREAY